MNYSYDLSLAASRPSHKSVLDICLNMSVVSEIIKHCYLKGSDRRDFTKDLISSAIIELSSGNIIKIRVTLATININKLRRLDLPSFL